LRVLGIREFPPRPASGQTATLYVNCSRVGSETPRMILRSRRWRRTRTGQAAGPPRSGKSRAATGYFCRVYSISIDLNSVPSGNVSYISKTVLSSLILRRTILMGLSFWPVIGSSILPV
jgi:hypothetical protein